MILIIHTADQSQVFVGLAKAGKLIAQKQFEAQYHQAEKLLQAIDQLLSACLPVGRAKSFNLKAVTGIAVVSGPGPFTALRIGIATANTLASALKIPIVGLKLNEFKNTAELAQLSDKKIKKTKIGNLIKPFYGREPNITIKK